MATIIKTVEIEAPAAPVWDAVSDFGAVHTRFAPGFVTDVALVPGGRLVTFGNGAQAHEEFLGVDHEHRRLAYSVRTERFDHHSASFTVEDLGAGRSRLVWIADVQPDTVAPFVDGMMTQGIAVAKQALENAPLQGELRRSG